MSIQHLSGQRITSSQVSNSTQTLRPGQIVQGKIVKLFPDNKAQIQLGTQKMIAQLEASLAVGGKYHFQVQASDNVIHLKVIGEQLKNQSNTNMVSLIRQLGLKPTKTNVALMQSLISEKIPFSKEQIQKAFQQLDGAQNKYNTQQIVKEMISARLPITDSVYQALAATNKTGMTDQMKSLLQQLRQDPNQTQLHQNLINRISQLTERPNQVVRQIISQAATNNQQLFNVLKSSGAVDANVEFSAWKSEWAAFSRQNNLASGNHAILPFELSNTKAIRLLEQMSGNSTNIRATSKAIVQTWGLSVETATANNTTLPGQEFAQLKQQISKSLMPIISGTQQQQLTKLIENNPAQMRQLLTVLQTMASSDTYTNIERTLTTMKLGESFLNSSPKEQFLGQLQQVLRFTGLNYENQLANNMGQQQTATIKSMLMQILQQSEGTVQDRSQQLLNFINGMQIQSVNDTTNFLQASLQIPAEKLDLPNDMQLEFEGKKSENGKINPDFCRIIFYLELAHLKETIIDMNIQKRAVAITIYNDQGEIADYSTSLKPMLKEGLESLNYKLSTITIKPIHENNHTDNDKLKTAYQNSYQGVDYWV
ncbi:hypothetical protein SAMN05216232_2781 [Virgibacillus subterraneus]|uniref:Flagellar hook-length control protein-like C-terminal domain-containing protein n=1 Tax=Virgibacillus subterraneus TaxID=621109 RepID=A0A1H9H9G4_9BACI|nr:hypothetical protein [Virgibacillus subterraneus]SEQ58962.1 hypothetical protein SAMN05216232_2781 [Virgibacillus subterraneus]